MANINSASSEPSYSFLALSDDAKPEPVVEFQSHHKPVTKTFK